MAIISVPRQRFAPMSGYRHCRLAAVAVAVAALVVAAGGCAVPFRCPAEGGPAWRELASEHFTVATDLDEEEASLALRDLEEYRAALVATAWPGGGDVGGRVRVVILARERDWRAFEGQRDGLFTGALSEPFIALRAAASDQTRITIRHELTHYVSRLRIPRQPDWLAEGLATFFETMAYDRRSGELLLGLPLPSRLASLRAAGFSVRATMSGARLDQDSDRFYASSWLIVHYLMSRQREGFSRYLQALESGQKSEPAWSAAFGAGLDPGALQAELRAHWAAGRPLVGSRRFRAPPFRTRSRPLDDATVHALRALLFLQGQGRQAPPAARAAARAEVTAALASDPHSLLALAVLGLELDEAPDLASARVVTRRQPRDWLAWAVLYRATGGDLDSAEGRRAAAIAVRLTADLPGVGLPFGPPRSFFARTLAASTCPGPAPVVRGGSAAGDLACGRGQDAGPRDVDAELRAVADSDVAWCLFEHPPAPALAVTVDIDPAGHPIAVCAQSTTAPAPDSVTACVHRVLGAVSFPGTPGCPRRRRFELAIATDGRITVFAR
jgi:hypothetical protein